MNGIIFEMIPIKLEQMKVLFFASSLFIFFACAVNKNTTSADSTTQIESTETMPLTMKIVKVKAEIGDLNTESAPITIESAEIRGNLLYLDVSYSGGCEEHYFRVIGSQMIAKSMPPIRGIKLIHDNNSDSCKKLEKVKLEINIKELAYKQEQGSEIYLNIDGLDQKLLYKYE